MTESAKVLLDRVRRATIESDALLAAAEALLRHHADLIESHTEISASFRESARSFIKRIETASRQN